MRDLFAMLGYADLCISATTDLQSCTSTTLRSLLLYLAMQDMTAENDGTCHHLQVQASLSAKSHSQAEA